MVKSKRRKFDDGGPVPGALDAPGIVSARKTSPGRMEGPVPETAISRRLPPAKRLFDRRSKWCSTLRVLRFYQVDIVHTV